MNKQTSLSLVALLLTGSLCAQPTWGLPAWFSCKQATQQGTTVGGNEQTNIFMRHPLIFGVIAVTGIAGIMLHLHAEQKKKHTARDRCKAVSNVMACSDGITPNKAIYHSSIDSSHIPYLPSYSPAMISWRDYLGISTKRDEFFKHHSELFKGVQRLERGAMSPQILSNMLVITAWHMQELERILPSHKAAGVQLETSCSLLLPLTVKEQAYEAIIYKIESVKYKHAVAVRKKDLFTITTTAQEE